MAIMATASTILNESDPAEIYISPGVESSMLSVMVAANKTIPAKTIKPATMASAIAAKRPRVRLKGKKDIRLLRKV